MRTKLVNGQPVPLTAAEEAQRDAEELAWANRPPFDPADTPLTPDDTERLLLSLGATPAQIAAAKRARP